MLRQIPSFVDSLFQYYASTYLPPPYATTQEINYFLNDLLEHYGLTPSPICTQEACYIPDPNRYSSVNGSINSNNLSPPVQVINSQAKDVLGRAQSKEIANQERFRKMIAVFGAICDTPSALIDAWTKKPLSNIHKELNRTIAFNNYLHEQSLDIQRELRPIVSKHFENLKSKAFWIDKLVVCIYATVTVSMTACISPIISPVAWASLTPGIYIVAAVSLVFSAVICPVAIVWHLAENHSLPSDIVWKIEQRGSYRPNVFGRWAAELARNGRASASCAG